MTYMTFLAFKARFLQIGWRTAFSGAWRRAQNPLGERALDFSSPATKKLVDEVLPTPAPGGKVLAWAG